MRLSKITRNRILDTCILLLLVVSGSQCASVKEILNLNTPEVSRTPRETQYYGSRYSSVSPGQTVSSRPIKPEDAPEARERDGTNVEKRCIRCEYYNNRDYRYPYEYKTKYDDYDNRNYRDRYDDRYRDRYDDYDRRYDTSDRKYYDTDRKYYDYDRRYDDRDRYDRDRYDRRPEYYDRYDRYDRDRYDDRYKYDRYDRYDNRGYRPWDETYRGSSGFDSSGRGYYFAVGRPEYSNYGSGYASNWNYGGGGGRGGYTDRDRGWGEQGFSTTSYRPRDPYDAGHSRGTSYLYGRPSSTTTTQSPSPPVGGSTVTDNPPTQSNTSSG